MEQKGKDNYPTVLVSGVFDILTVGHFNLFTFADNLRGYNGRLFVGLDSDQKVKKDKGRNRPIFTFEERRSAILSLDIGDVEDVFCFNTNEELYQKTKEIMPTYVVKSDQWKNNVIGSDLSKVIYFNTLKNFSTSKVIERVLEKYRYDLSEPA